MRLKLHERKVIAERIRIAEMKTSGEIRVHISFKHDSESPLDVAKKMFEKLEMHQTRERNGVLIYFNFHDHRFAIWGDQGIHEKVGSAYWEQLAFTVKTSIRTLSPTEGILTAIDEVGVQLSRFFPVNPDNPDELSNEPSESN